MLRQILIKRLVLVPVVLKKPCRPLFHPGNACGSLRSTRVYSLPPESPSPSATDGNDDDSKVARIDLKALAAEQGSRRTVLVGFTCNKCNGRTNRLVNPLALKRGTVWVQCGGCESWHMLVDNLDMVEEYRLDKATGQWSRVNVNAVQAVKEALAEAENDGSEATYFEAGDGPTSFTPEADADSDSEEIQSAGGKGKLPDI